MKERILGFLTKENKSSAHFAEEIGVQPSGISHILSGRNKPSLDFVIKMLERYPYLSSDWLLFGKGSMYKGKSSPTLFDNIIEEAKDDDPDSGAGVVSHDLSPKNTVTDAVPDSLHMKAFEDTGEIKEIVWFYKDGTFKSFVSRKD